MSNPLVEGAEALIETIDATGGVTHNEAGELVPVGDSEWIDLAHAYLLLCEACSHEPKIVDSGGVW